MNRFRIFQFYLLFLLIINVFPVGYSKRKKPRCDATWTHPWVAFAGPKEFISITCSTCGKKFEKDYSDVYWLKKRRDGTNEKRVIVDGKHLSRIRKQSNQKVYLMISNVRLEDAGLYTCMKGNAIQGRFDLAVNLHPYRKNVFVALGEREAGITKDENGDTLMYIDWGGWSECNRCREEGERKRHGECWTKLYTTPWRTKGIQCLFAAKYDTKLSDEERKTYAGGSNEIMYEECYREKCPLNDRGAEAVALTRGSRLNEKNVLLLGINSPELTNSISKLVGENIVLLCPGTRMASNFLSWRKGAKAISNTAMKKQGRLNHIEVDWTNNLHIRGLTIEDSGQYSCWQNYRLVAIIKLSVAKRYLGSNIDLKKYATHVATGLFVAILLLFILLLGIITSRARENIRQGGMLTQEKKRRTLPSPPKIKEVVK